MEQSGKGLSMLGNDRWKGGETHNGTLLKIHDNSFTIGYSKLTPAFDVPAKFGFGVFYDASLKDNQIFGNVADTVSPVFAGILTRQVHIATGYPVANNQIDEYNKALVAKEGYIVYKTGYDPVAGTEVQDFDDIEVGMLLCINQANGRFHFAAVLPAAHTEAGKVIALNPDDRSWTVKIAV